MVFRVSRNIWQSPDLATIHRYGNKVQHRLSDEERYLLGGDSEAWFEVEETNGKWKLLKRVPPPPPEPEYYGC